MNQGAGRRVLMKKTACKKSHATVPLSRINQNKAKTKKRVNLHKTNKAKQRHTKQTNAQLSRTKLPFAKNCQNEPA